MINLDKTSNHVQCFLSKDNDSWLWHKRITHINMEHLNKLISKYLVIGLPNLRFKKDRLCDACQKGKQVKVSFKSKNIVSTTQLLQLLHMDLFGPSRTMSFGGNYYFLVSQPTLRRECERPKQIGQSICLRGRKRAELPPTFI